MSGASPTRQKPLIGLPGRRKIGGQVEGFPDNLATLAIDLYLADYAGSVHAAGGLPVHLAMDVHPSEYLDHLDGIVLTGGADVAPEHYQATADGNGAYEPERDELELALLAGALEFEIPVLGICRGLQIINVQAGGTLHQDIPPHARYDVAPESRVHPVEFDPESRLGLLYRSPIEVNSLHHQTVDELGSGVKATAWDEAGSIEGLEIPGQDVIGVQWHPEMLLEPEPVFDWLIRRAVNRRAETVG